MQKPHIIPIAVNLFRSLPKLIKLGSAPHYVQLEGNVISINNPPLGVSDKILEELRIIFRKYCYKNLHKLHLRFNSCNGLTRFTLKKLRLEIVASFRELRELTLEFYFCNVKNKSLIMFLTSIRNVTKRLQKYAISFIGCRKINGKVIECLRSLFIPNLKALQNLALNFSQELTRSDDNNELLFGPNIEKRIVASRRKYERSHPVSLISNQSVLGLVNTCTKYLRNLQRFVFIPPYFNNPSISDHQTYREMIISAIKNFEKLNKFYIQLQSLTTEYLDEISFYIGKYLNSLKYLSIDIHLDSLFSNITDQDLATLATNIVSQTPTLRGLALSFNDDTSVSDEGLWNFGIVLCQLAKNLEEFVLQIRPSFSANNQKFEDFVSAITNQLTCLKRCTLSILQTVNQPIGENQNKKITQIQQALPQSASQSLQEFSLYYLNNFNLCSLNFLTKLKSLTISFDDCGEMTNDDCIKFTRNLFQLSLQDLEQFTLRCRNSRQISDKSIISFCSHDWSCLSRLNSLALEFSSSKFITNSAVEHIEVLILKNLKNLQRFSLGFLCCDRITEGGIISLVNTITEKHSDIKELVLDFHHGRDKRIGFPDRTKMIKNEMSANLKSLEKLKLNF